MSRALRKSWRAKKRGKRKGSGVVAHKSQTTRTYTRRKKAEDGTERLTAETYYAFGKIETIIEGIAGRAGISPAILARGVAELLVAKTHR
jgi:hypothetical protein